MVKMKVLIVKTSSMGDVLHTLPALTDAQKALPDVRFDWVVEENFAEIPHWHCAVDKVIPVAIRRWRKQPFSAETKNQWKNYRTFLQTEQYDAVIDAQGLLKSALLVTRPARGEKYGYSFSCAREGLAAFFYDHKFNIPYQQHAVERIRRLFAQSLSYALPDEKGDYGIASHFRHAAKAIDNPYIMFIHATTRADKFWINAEWTKLARLLAAKGYHIHLPWGNEREYEQAQQIAQNIPQVKILPKLSLSALAEEIAQSSAVVSVDTGLAHLTAALDIPNITLYGATDPKLIGTYGKNQHHLTKETMRAISAEEVFERFFGVV
ncbi:RfaF protein [[Mannheimia] succiniciproducens MBEL55E]|uniref:Lipopolysaccharide heptosyltransferase 1 n=2 Tax=Basfia TaxID=697331 RepID=Q65Q94_MANSM|nr:RfaF protein [[Mannheimia] succiniciproducens MBEL55E]